MAGSSGLVLSSLTISLTCQPRNIHEGDAAVHGAHMATNGSNAKHRLMLNVTIRPHRGDHRTKVLHREACIDIVRAPHRVAHDHVHEIDSGIGMAGKMAGKRDVQGLVHAQETGIGIPERRKRRGRVHDRGTEMIKTKSV